MKEKKSTFTALGIEDYIYPLIFVLVLLLVGYVIWTLVSPYIAVLVGGLVTYILFLRDIISKKK